MFIDPFYEIGSIAEAAHRCYEAGGDSLRCVECERVERASEAAARDGTQRRIATDKWLDPGADAADAS